MCSSIIGRSRRGAAAVRGSTSWQHASTRYNRINRAILCRQLLPAATGLATRAIGCPTTAGEEWQTKLSTRHSQPPAVRPQHRLQRALYYYYQKRNTLIGHLYTYQNRSTQRLGGCVGGWGSPVGCFPPCGVSPRGPRCLGAAPLRAPVLLSRVAASSHVSVFCLLWHPGAWPTARPPTW